ncbi:MAG: TRAP transporter TatT component family protein [Gammaproteobacteria bacterium]|nr:TRAP transporter TatT component family protein [Gammaproteobacteria bacterium]MCW8840632.1 TRAP transporter TatT component family protein [Gammaproteobacteria bacterium]MCW8928101.1 TRAP transporter TatT component family protein [Gammaproteobacteria bacterium]MCW8959852.1 TRAP transporter TatT component family protein [Gammaproteobacteria bacterium]MCW8973034.1 TRAP transporter TatT component family protein [Gammaproteobacteria bacterium]
MSRLRITRIVGLLIIGLALAGCTTMVISKLGDNLSEAIINQDDPDTVRAGAPAYLLMIDGLISGNPGDRRLLVAGSRLYSAYAAVFVEDRERAKRMAVKAKGYAERALCLDQPAICERSGQPYLEFLPAIRSTGYDELPALYAYALSSALWIQTHSDDWSAVAELPKVEAMLERVITLDKNYERGDPYVYLGIIRTQLPPALGGQPEKGRQAFEEAIEIAQGNNLMAKVEYARRYARLVFDRELHDRLLHEVLAADPQVPGFTLSNVLAQRQAKELLQSAADYF